MVRKVGRLEHEHHVSGLQNGCNVDDQSYERGMRGDGDRMGREGPGLDP